MSYNNCIKFVNFIKIIKTFCIKFKNKIVKNNIPEQKNQNYRFGSGKIKNDDKKIEIIIDNMNKLENNDKVRKRVENTDSDDNFEIIDESELE